MRELENCEKKMNNAFKNYDSVAASAWPLSCTPNYRNNTLQSIMLRNFRDVRVILTVLENIYSDYVQHGLGSFSRSSSAKSYEFATLQVAAGRCTAAYPCLVVGWCGTSLPDTMGIIQFCCSGWSILQSDHRAGSVVVVGDGRHGPVWVGYRLSLTLLTDVLK